MSKTEINKYIKLFLKDNNLKPYERFTLKDMPDNMYFYFASYGDIMCENEDGAEYTGLLKEFLDGIEIVPCWKEPKEPFYPTNSEFVWYTKDGHNFHVKSTNAHEGVRLCRDMEEAFHYQNIINDFNKSTLPYDSKWAHYVIIYNYKTQKLEFNSELKDIPMNCRAFTTEVMADDFIYRWGEEFILHYLFNIYEKGDKR